MYDGGTGGVYSNSESTVVLSTALIQGKSENTFNINKLMEGGREIKDVPLNIKRIRVEITQYSSVEGVRPEAEIEHMVCQDLTRDTLRCLMV